MAPALHHKRVSTTLSWLPLVLFSWTGGCFAESEPALTCAESQDVGDGSCLLQHRGQPVKISRHSVEQATSMAEVAKRMASDVKAGKVNRTGLGDDSPFSVVLSFQGIEQWYDPASQYVYAQCPYGPGGDCLGSSDSWKSNGEKQWENLHTAQFQVTTAQQDPSIPDRLKINDGRDSPVACARIYVRDKYQDVSLGWDGFEITDYWNGRDDADHDPLYVTVIPYMSTDTSDHPPCDGSDIDWFDSRWVISVFISIYNPRACDTEWEYCCDMSDGGAGYLVNDKNLGKDTPCSVVNTNFYPEYDETNDRHLLIYKGTFTDLMMNLDGRDEKNLALRIILEPGTNLYYPINNIIQRLVIDTTSDPADASANIDRCQNWATGGGADCRISGYEELTYNFKKKIIIEGLGRVNGWMWVGLYRSKPFEGGKIDFSSQSYDANDIAWVMDKDNMDAIFWNTDPATQQPHGFNMDDGPGNYPSPVQYRMLSASMVLSATWGQYSKNVDCSEPNGGSCKDYYNCGYAIDVSGIQVGFGPKRMGGATQFNSMYTSAVDSPDQSDVDPDLNNVCSKLFDMKVVGNWVDASDGPENLGDSSVTTKSYLHVNDDSLKVAAPNLKIDGNTILQGNVGSAINLGSFGKNRGISGSLITKTYIHRITHNCFGDDWPACGYDGNNGVIATRGCPTYSMYADSRNVGLQDATVDGVYVMSAGDVNSVMSLFALGVDARPKGEAQFCMTDKWVDQGDPFVIKNIKLLNVLSYENPQGVIRIINYPDGKPVQWDQFAFSFYGGTYDDPDDDNTPKLPVDASQMQGDELKYMVCAVCPELSTPPSAGPPDCSSQERCFNQGGSFNGATKNLYFDGDLFDVLGNEIYSAIEFPYDSWSNIGRPDSRRRRSHRRRCPFHKIIKGKGKKHNKPKPSPGR